MYLLNSQDGLRCFQRVDTELVPSCSGEGVPGVDYCFDRPDNYLLWVARNPEVTLGRCEGDCDADDGR